MYSAEAYRASSITSRDWGIQNITSVESYMQSGYHNGVVKIKQGENAYAYKPYSATSERLVTFTSDVLAHLERSGFHSFPRLLPTLSGQYYVKTSEGDLGILSPWINGERISPADSDDTKSTKLKALARTVAEFHNSVNSFPLSSDTIHDETMVDSWIPEMIERHAQVEKVLGEQNNVFDQLSLGRDIRELVEKSGPFMVEMSDRERIGKIEQFLTKGIIHADLWIGHWLFADEDHVFLIDFDRIRHGRRLDDIERIISESMDLNTKFPKMILEEYRKYAYMSEEDLESLPMYLRYSIVRRTFWLLDQFVKRGTILVNMPLNLVHEVEKATNILSQDIELMLH